MLTDYKLSVPKGTKPVIEVQDVSVRYRVPRERIPSLKEYAIRWLKRSIGFHEFWALRGINLSIFPGEVFGIIGPNGAGKSTLLKVIARVIKPTNGYFKIRGRVAPLLELGAGFDPELTGRENIFLNGAILGYSQMDLESRFDRIVDFAGLSGFIDAPLRTYSTGMVARLGFSVATDVQPDILIVDEVLGVGDAEFQYKSFGRISTFCENGSTILLVSHGLDAIQKMCNRVAWLDQGKLQALGSPAEVVRLYQDEALKPYFGEQLAEQYETPEAFEKARKSGEVFGEYYFQYCCGQPYRRSPIWLNFFNAVAHNIVNQFNVKKVLDAGCAMGFLVEALRERGVDAYGIDISQYAIQSVKEEIKPFCLTGSITLPLADHYDMIICIEVLQNLTDEEGRKAVANFSQYSESVIVSVNPADRRVATYVNVQPLEYWEELFAQNGFIRDETIDVSFITPWAMYFVRNNITSDE